MIWFPAEFANVHWIYNCEFLFALKFLFPDFKLVSEYFPWGMVLEA